MMKAILLIVGLAAIAARRRAPAGSEYSDVRHKRAMIPIDDIADKLQTIDAFAYTDEDGERRIGVSAQSVQVYFPEAVQTDAGGRLSVAYGSLALAGLVDYVKDAERRYQAVTADIRAMRRRLDAIDKRTPPYVPLQIDSKAKPW